MTFPSVRSLGVTRSYSDTNNTFAAPAGVVAGDLLLAFIGLDSPQSLPWSSRIPAGWTMIVSDTVTTNVFHAIYGIAYKVAGGSEPSTYAFNMGGGGFGRIAAIQDVSGSTPINVSAATNNASSTTPSVPSVTTTAADCLLIGFYGITDSGGTYTFTPPGGATEIIDEKASTQNACFGAYTRTLTSAGASGADTVTVSAARAVWAGAVAIAPVASADTTAPVLSSPVGVGATLTGSGTVSTDEANGTLWWKADGTSTASDPGAGSEAGAGWSSQSVSATGTQTVSSFGALSAGTTYVHYLHVDAAGNRSTVASSSSFTVAAAGTPAAPARAFKLAILNH